MQQLYGSSDVISAALCFDGETEEIADAVGNMPSLGRASREKVELRQTEIAALTDNYSQESLTAAIKTTIEAMRKLARMVTD